jgi:hypothetical protein
MTTKCKEAQEFANRTCKHAGNSAMASKADEFSAGKQAVGDMVRGFQCVQAISAVEECHSNQPSPSILEPSRALTSGIVASGLTSDPLECHSGLDLERAETLVEDLKTVDRKTVGGAILLIGAVAASVLLRRPPPPGLISTSAEKTVRLKTGMGTSGKFTYTESMFSNGDLLFDLHIVEAWKTGSKIRPYAGVHPKNPKTVGIWNGTENYFKQVARSRGKTSFQLRMQLVNVKLDSLLTKKYTILENIVLDSVKTFRIPCLSLATTFLSSSSSLFSFPSLTSDSLALVSGLNKKIQDDKTRRWDNKKDVPFFVMPKLEMFNQSKSQSPPVYTPPSRGPLTPLQKRIDQPPQRMMEIQTQVITVKTAEWSATNTCYLGPDGNVWTVSPNTKEITKVDNYPYHLRESLPLRSQFMFPPGAHFAYPGGHKEYVNTQSVPALPPPPPVHRRFCGKVFDPFGSGGWKEDQCDRCRTAQSRYNPDLLKFVGGIWCNQAF